jgi:hypothetical protein
MAVVLLGLPLASAAGPGEILRQAEEVRSPSLDYAVDFSISVADDYTPGKTRTASYTMIAAGKARAIILMLGPDPFFGGTLLSRDREFWLLLPLASRAIQLSSKALLRGDESSGELARTDLSEGYDAKLDGEEPVDGEPCFRLELAARSADSAFPRVRAFIAKGKVRPVKYEYYGRDGALRRTARYGDYKKTPLGTRPMKLTIDSDVATHRTTTMVFSNLRRADASTVDFSPEGMIPFRDAARNER